MVSYKATNNETNELGYCLYIWDNLCDTIYQYIADNKHCFKTKNSIHHTNVVTRAPWTYFLSRNIS